MCASRIAGFTACMGARHADGSPSSAYDSQRQRAGGGACARARPQACRPAGSPRQALPTVLGAFGRVSCPGRAAPQVRRFTSAHRLSASPGAAPGATWTQLPANLMLDAAPPVLEAGLGGVLCHCDLETSRALCRQRVPSQGTLWRTDAPLFPVVACQVDMRPAGECAPLRALEYIRLWVPLRVVASTSPATLHVGCHAAAALAGRGTDSAAWRPRRAEP